MLLTVSDILNNWHAQGALWLMLEPDLIKKNITAFINAIEQCTQSEAQQILLADMASISHDKLISIRMTVARNPHTPAAVLRTLAQDKRCHALVAVHPQTPITLVEALAQDRRKDIRIAVARRAHLPTHIASKLLPDREQQVRAALAKNPDLPTRLLEQLARDGSWLVRQAALENLQMGGGS